MLEQPSNYLPVCVDKPSKTGDMINDVHQIFSANTIVGFAACLVQEEMLKTDFSHKSVRKQEVFASKKHVPVGGKRHHTNQTQNDKAKHVIWFLRNRRKFWEEQRRKIDSNRDSKF